MKVAVVSSVYGDFDRIHVPRKQDIDTDWIMVTDREDIPSPWRTIVERRPLVAPRLASRVAKCNPWLYTDADVVVWKDGNIEVTSPHFTEWCLDSLGSSLICQRQQLRPDIFAEVNASFQLDKWAGQPLREQADHYVSQGYPPDYGIWWCGFMIRSKNCPDFGDQWLREMVRWTCQDQMAFSYIMWKLGIKPAALGDRDRVQQRQQSDGSYEIFSEGIPELFTLHLHPDNTK